MKIVPGQVLLDIHNRAFSFIEYIKHPKTEEVFAKLTPSEKDLEGYYCVTINDLSEYFLPVLSSTYLETIQNFNRLFNLPLNEDHKKSVHPSELL